MCSAAQPGTTERGPAPVQEAGCAPACAALQTAFPHSRKEKVRDAAIATATPRKSRPHHGRQLRHRPRSRQAVCAPRRQAGPHGPPPAGTADAGGRDRAGRRPGHRAGRRRAGRAAGTGAGRDRHGALWRPGYRLQQCRHDRRSLRPPRSLAAGLAGRHRHQSHQRLSGRQAPDTGPAGTRRRLADLHLHLRGPYGGPARHGRLCRQQGRPRRPHPGHRRRIRPPRPARQRPAARRHRHSHGPRQHPHARGARLRRKPARAQAPRHARRNRGGGAVSGVGRIQLHHGDAMVVDGGVSINRT